jgi:succinate dehydrogenase / fumarate reductase membrane anchor subunit
MRQGSAIGRVRGLGSAKSGAHHWWLERLTSVSTLLLFIWFLVSLLRLPSLSHGVVTDWLASPLAAVPMLPPDRLHLLAFEAGMQVIIEDYVHEEGLKLFTITCSISSRSARGRWPSFRSSRSLSAEGKPDGRCLSDHRSCVRRRRGRRRRGGASRDDGRGRGGAQDRLYNQGVPDAQPHGRGSGRDRR